MYPINTSTPVGRSFLRDIAIVGGFFGAPFALAALFYFGRCFFLYVRGVIKAATIRVPTAPYPPGEVEYAAKSAYTPPAPYVLRISPSGRRFWCWSAPT
jgi:hypothetical protein